MRSRVPLGRVTCRCPRTGRSRPAPTRRPARESSAELAHPRVEFTRVRQWPVQRKPRSPGVDLDAGLGPTQPATKAPGRGGRGLGAHAVKPLLPAPRIREQTRNRASARRSRQPTLEPFALRRGRPPPVLGTALFAVDPYPPPLVR